MVKIYQDYDEEPEDIFLPLPEELACEFYALEMDGFTADIDFFGPLLPRHGTVLELGCGTGRIASKLAELSDGNRFIMGIDISIPMLRLARQKAGHTGHHPFYLCMDMTRLGFRKKFDAILIPYNTLNLLCSKDRIIECLQGCKNILQPGGRLLVQVFVPTGDFIRQRKTFQFQMFDRPGNGKIIKEQLKHYEPQSLSIQVEERFRVRPMQEGEADEDWNSIYCIAAFSADQWFSFFNEVGFTLTSFYGDYTGTPYQQSSSTTLLASLTL
ncbi:MAG: class I SAM-dependent methyltransferase [Desulforhopalus sp.]